MPTIETQLKIDVSWEYCEAVIAKKVKEIQEMLKNVDGAPSEFHVRIEAGGRVHSGDLKISYEICKNQFFNSESVKAGKLMDAFEEFCRRHGWEKRHQPVQISYRGT